MIKAIIFDCYGVMYLPKQDYVYQSLLVSPRINGDEIHQLERAADYGLIDENDLFAFISKSTGMKLEDVRRYLVKGFVRNHELLDYSQRLRGTYKIGLLSNISPQTMLDFFAPAEQAQFFDTVVMSGRVGMVKPHPEIYEYTCDQLGVDTSEAIMIDDLEENCAGAREAGLRAIRYQSIRQIRRELDALLHSTVK